MRANTSKFLTTLTKLHWYRYSQDTGLLHFPGPERRSSGENSKKPHILFRLPYCHLTFVTGWFVLQLCSLLFMMFASFNLQHLKAHYKGMAHHCLSLCTCLCSWSKIWDGIFLIISFSYFSHPICRDSKQAKDNNCVSFSYILLHMLCTFELHNWAFSSSITTPCLLS